MADAYWRYVDPRYQPAPAHAPAAAAAAAAPVPAATPVKRPRSNFDDLSVGEYLGYYPRGEDRTGHRPIADTEVIGSSYDRYIHNGMSSFGAAESVRPVAARSVHDHMVGAAGMDGRNVRYRDGRPEASLPLDASGTLYVEGLPANCTRREVSHIFRPFVGFQEVRLVKKESKHPGGDPLILCFVDFNSPGQAAVALEALQGYKFDEHDRESNNLRLQFARFPGPRSAGGPRGRR